MDYPVHCLCPDYFHHARLNVFIQAYGLTLSNQIGRDLRYRDTKVFLLSADYAKNVAEIFKMSVA